MAQFFHIHPDNPQARLINQAADILKQGGVVVYPTDCSYSIGCHLGDKNALDRIRTIRQLSPKHHFTLMCRDLKDLGYYAHVDNSAYRLLKSITPGPFTFILRASKEVPRRLMHPKRKTIGMRVPENQIVQDLLQALGEPIMTTTLLLPGETTAMTDPHDIYDAVESRVDLIIDGGYGELELTTVLDMVEGHPQLIRQGKGDVVDLLQT